MMAVIFIKRHFCNSFSELWAKIQPVPFEIRAASFQLWWAPHAWSVSLGETASGGVARGHICEKVKFQRSSCCCLMTCCRHSVNKAERAQVFQKATSRNHSVVLPVWWQFRVECWSVCAVQARARAFLNFRWVVFWRLRFCYPGSALGASHNKWFFLLLRNVCGAVPSCASSS